MPGLTPALDTNMYFLNWYFKYNNIDTSSQTCVSHMWLFCHALRVFTSQMGKWNCHDSLEFPNKQFWMYRSLHLNHMFVELISSFNIFYLDPCHSCADIPIYFTDQLEKLDAMAVHHINNM